MSPEDFDRLSDGDIEFEQALMEAERSLLSLKQRYERIRHDTQRQEELQKREEQLQKEWRSSPSPALEKELRQIKEQLQELEITLESALLSDRHLKALFWQGLRNGLIGEVFWQIVRFGGLGIAIGWLLRSYAGH
jgi:type II secretory pathway component PulJ